MSFRLASNNSDFNSRVSSLFDSLESASKEHKKSPLESEAIDRNVQNSKCNLVEISHNIDDSCFKKPYNKPRSTLSKKNASKKYYDKYTPDYIKNPNKWKCYSLEDTECKNDSENQLLALELVSSLKQKSELPYTKANEDNSKEVKEIDIESQDTNVTSMDIIPESLEQSLPLIRSSSEHFILPNYEIGKTKSIKKHSNKNKTLRIEKSKEITLSHLIEEGYEDE